MGRSYDGECTDAVDVAVLYLGRHVFGRTRFQAQTPTNQSRHRLCLEFALPLRESGGAIRPASFLIATQMSAVDVANLMSQGCKSLRQFEAAVDSDPEPCAASELERLRVVGTVNDRCRAC